MTKETHPHWNYPAARRADREGHRLACEDLARMHPSQLDVGNPNHPIHSRLAPIMVITRLCGGIGSFL